MDLNQPIEHETEDIAPIQKPSVASWQLNRGCFKCHEMEIFCIKCHEPINTGLYKADDGKLHPIQEFTCVPNHTYPTKGLTANFHEHLPWCCGKHEITDHQFQKEQEQRKTEEKQNKKKDWNVND